MGEGGARPSGPTRRPATPLASLALGGLAPGRPRRERKSTAALCASMTSSGFGWHPLAKTGTLDGFPGPPAKGSAGQSPSSPTRYARGAPTHVPSVALPAARAELDLSAV